jgi:V/A-type H+-transporting ATPase subunit I
LGVAPREARGKRPAVRRAQRGLPDPGGETPGRPIAELTPDEAAREVLDIQRRTAERRNRLAALFHQLEQISVWGNLELKDVRELRGAGVDVRFYAVPARAARGIRAECAEVVADLPGERVLVAVANRGAEAALPPEATLMPLPPRDAPAIRAEAAQIDAALRRDAERLRDLTSLASRIEAELMRLRQQADWSVALRGAAADEHLFALQGWAPGEVAASLGEQLGARDIAAAVEVLDPAPDEEPPTLVRPPAWARPVEGLFRMLGTIPGYREFDVSIPFMVALPIFAAMLISDAGYGGLLLGATLLAYRRASARIGARFTQLLAIVGGVSLAWGAATASFFGFTLYRPLIPIDLSEGSRQFMMRLSFTLGAVHLSAAQLWQAVRYYPHPRFLGRLGWALFIWGMYGVVKMLVLKWPMGWHTPWPYLLLGGAALAVVFASPSRNLAKMLALGLAQFPLSMLSAFSDVISYVRLMAVGLASSVLAVSFNQMALAADSWLLAAVVLLFGHGLNLGLALIAMFAHGVRLNMLEFSSNLGMQWTGYAYRPFTQHPIREHTP